MRRFWVSFTIVIVTAVLIAIATAVLIPAHLFAQAQAGQQVGIIKVKAISRTIKAVTYRPKSGDTRIDFQGTPLMPYGLGEARVDAKESSVFIEAEFKKLEPPTKFGGEYLTYVLWAITPEGRTSNLGELVLDGDSSEAKVTTRLFSFGLIVTAEPYFAVAFPSEVVVLENVIRKDTKGKVEEVDAKFELLQRGNYEEAKLGAFQIDPKVPLELYQARNAVRIAKWREADKYAPESWSKAEKALQQAEDYVKRKQPKKSIMMVSRESVQMAEDAGMIALKRKGEEQLGAERQQALEREAKGKAETEAAEARKKAEEESRRKAEAATADAEAARQTALMKEEQARAQAEIAREAAQRAEAEKQALRARLLEQFNRILETRDTPRGLVVTMADVLFDTGKYDLRPAARERLAKLSGIVLSHPGLNLEIEGHTDSTGGDELNQRLSEQRAGSVLEYLTQEGLPRNSLTAKGYGKTMPIADNQTAEGRQKNRRVEIVVSGEVIGTHIGKQPLTQR
jgi:outer membrane protein OmpA-like peptidoglycan-associated protein